MISELQTLKDICDTARQAIDRGREPMDELKQIQDLIGHLAENTKDLYDKSEEYKKFFYQEMTPGVIKRLTKERSNDDKVSSNDVWLRVVPGNYRTYTE